MKKLWHWFNPDFKNFVSGYKNITLLGFYWSMVWRFIVFFYIVWAIFLLGMALIGLMFRYL